MGWTTPRTWVAGEIVTAALLNTHLRDNMNVGRGADAAVRDTTDIVYNSTSFISLDTNLDLVMTAAAGDWVEYSVALNWISSLVVGYLEGILVASSGTMSYSADVGALKSSGIVGAEFTNPTGQTQASIMRSLGAGDVSAGAVQIRLYGRTSIDTNMTISCSGAAPLAVWGKNFGPAV